MRPMALSCRGRDPPLLFGVHVRSKVAVLSAHRNRARRRRATTAADALAELVLADNVLGGVGALGGALAAARLPALRALDATDNVVAMDDDGYRAAVLGALPQLVELDGTRYPATMVLV